MRINKYLADCGLASRRAAEQFILQGKIKVNGKIITNLATDIDEIKDIVSFEDNAISLPSEFTYIMLHKPKGFLCTKSDEKGRKTVFDLIKDIDKRLFTVGRLDYDTEGLLLLTDDGDLAQRLTHPSSEIGKTYVAKVEGTIPENDLALLRNGVVLDDGFKTSKSAIHIVDAEKDTRLEITIFEGHNRQIKRMFEAIGKEVGFLKRVRIGELKLGGLTRGKYRKLTDKEINYLKNM